MEVIGAAAFLASFSGAGAAKRGSAPKGTDDLSLNAFPRWKAIGLS
jgi:hypothetical protein